MSVLATELASDPLVRGYSGMSDSAVTASLNVVDRPAAVPAKDVRRYLLLAGKWPGIVDAANHDASASVRKAAVNIVDTLANFEDFDLQDATVLAAVTAGLDGVIAEGLIEAAQKIVILAMENNRQSRAEELGLSPVKQGQVEVARAV